MSLCIKGCGRASTRRGMCHSHYETHRTRQRAYGKWETLYVDTVEVRTHILYLQSQGMGTRRIADLAGVARNNVREVLTPRTGREPSAKMLRRNAEKILAVRPEPALGAAVDACGTVRRLRALVAIGWTQSELCRRLEMLPGNGCRIFRGEQTHVTAATAARAKQIYDELAMSTGPSDRARTHAKTRKWAPPLAWDDDDIDNPQARPDLGERKTVPWEEKYREMREVLGLTQEQIAARLGIERESLLRQLDRHGVAS